MAKKILHIGQMIGGLDVYIRNSIVNSDDTFEFVIAHGKDDKSVPVEKNGVPVKEYHTSLQRSLGLRDITTIREMVNIIRHEHPDLVHCHSAKGGVVGRIAAFLTHTPAAYTPHAFSYLCSPSGLKRAIYLGIERMTRLGAYVMACSSSEQQLAQNEVGYDETHSLTWHNAVPDCKDAFSEPTELPKEPYICYIGRPSYQKNMELLVDVVERVHAKHPQVKLMLLGVGYYAPDLEALNADLKSRGLEEAVMMKPWLSHEDTLGYLKNSLFYLSTSRYEGLPLSVVEAMSLGKAVVATRVTGNVDCVDDGVTGFLGEGADEIAAACIRLIEEEDTREQMGRKARELFETEFDIRKRIGLLTEAYNSILHK